jgi:hypothetical protein
LQLLAMLVLVQEIALCLKQCTYSQNGNVSSALQELPFLAITGNACSCAGDSSLSEAVQLLSQWE